MHFGSICAFAQTHTYKIHIAALHWKSQMQNKRDEIKDSAAKSVCDFGLRVKLGMVEIAFSCSFMSVVISCWKIADWEFSLEKFEMMSSNA